jgi:chaperonin GroEL
MGSGSCRFGVLFLGMSKKIVPDATEARRKVLEGVRIAGDLIRGTMGPGGGNVFISNTPGGHCVSTKDGVTVARNIELSDEEQNIGAQLIKFAAMKTNDMAGDGTTTTAVLASTLAPAAVQAVEGGRNGTMVQRGMARAADEVCKIVKSLKTTVYHKDLDSLQKIASISGNDPDIGSIVGKAFHDVGEGGYVTFEPGGQEDSTVEFISGFRADRGYESPHFITNPARMECSLNDCHVFITDHRIVDARVMLAMLENFLKGAGSLRTDYNLVIVAEQVAGDALATLARNHQDPEVPLRVCAIRAPGNPGNRQEVLEDLAAFCGARFISKDSGLKLESLDSNVLGKVKSVVAEEEETVFVGEPDLPSIKTRAGMIREAIGQLKDKDKVQALQERLAVLLGQTAVIKIGSKTWADLAEKRYRFEDAVNATRSALKGGVVPGGGVTLLHIKGILPVLTEEHPDYIFGYELVRQVLDQPFKEILRNCGAEPQQYISKIKFPQVVDGYTLEVKDDAFEAGILDPAQVSVTAVEAAANVAGLVANTRSLMTYDIEAAKRQFQ